jgi:Tol biopolymer transport system component
VAARVPLIRGPRIGRGCACALLTLLGAMIPAVVGWAGELGEPPPAAAAGTEVPAAGERQPPGEVLPLVPERRIEFDTDEGTWLSLDRSPDGRRIIFDLLGDLYVVDAAGGEARAITRGLGFDTQPAFSPDGSQIAFVSDRSGADNLWVAQPDGSDPRQISFRSDGDTFISPAWSADGKTLYVSHYRADLNVYELWQYPAGGSGKGTILLPARQAPDTREEEWRSVLGAAPSADGRYLYYAAHVGKEDYQHLPEWVIRRLDLRTHAEETLVSPPRSPRPDLSLGSSFRPAISPDGNTLVYAVRHDGETGLRVLDLRTGSDRWLAFPVQQDQLMSLAAQDLLPRYTFTADGGALLLTRHGHIERLELASGEFTPIPFKAHVAVDVGASLRRPLRQETGPVRARLIQTPVMSPDGRQLAFSAFGSVYLMTLTGHATPVRLTDGATPEFQPAWSPDGRTVTYVSWTARDGGAVWLAATDRSSPPRRLTDVGAYYTQPTFAPDGQEILTLRSSQSVRMHSYMEYGSLRDAELIRIPVAGGPATVVTRGIMGGRPQWTAELDRVYLNFGDGLNAVPLDGSPRTLVVSVVGPGWYFREGPAQVDDLKLSPDGRFALAQIAQQLHLVAVPSGADRRVDLSHPTVAHRRLTSVGADFFEWAGGGRMITWSVGSTFYRRPLATVALDVAGATPLVADVPPPGHGGVDAFEAVVTRPRDVPSGALVFRGATVITMRQEQVIRDADLVVVDNRIAAVGPRGSVPIPARAEIRDVQGKYIVPGFVDAHDHLADIRRGELDFDTWGPLANLAYGVTTAFDPSPLSIDMLAYEDLMDAGLMTGSRIHSTGPALFSFNDFRSRQEVDAVLSRYTDHYRTFNLKEYRTGNRRVREWVAQACRQLGIVPTTEGALSLKLDLTQIMDGFAGHEHALPTVPLYRDVIELIARTRVSYTLTLQVTNGGPEGQDYYIARAAPHDDPKLNRFSPHFVIDIKTLQREWRDPREYLLPRLAASAASVVRAGGLVAVGTHGEMPGIGFHWELHAYVSGGMTPHEALRTGTMGSAEAIGRDAEFGSIEPGKYADLIVLDRDPLADISNTLSIRLVMKGGRVYDGSTLDEQWPRPMALHSLWFWTDVPKRSN